MITLAQVGLANMALGGGDETITYFLLGLVLCYAFFSPYCVHPLHSVVELCSVVIIRRNLLNKEFILVTESNASFGYSRHTCDALVLLGREKG